jgi:hypothetical protein
MQAIKRGAGSAEASSDRALGNVLPFDFVLMRFLIAASHHDGFINAGSLAGRGGTSSL